MANGEYIKNEAGSCCSEGYSYRFGLSAGESCYMHMHTNILLYIYNFIYAHLMYQYHELSLNNMNMYDRTKRL